MFDWTRYLATYFRKLTGIKKFHHFTFTQNKLTVKEFSDTEESEVDLLKGEHPPADVMPDRIQPEGLDAKRQWYLYEEIRQFASEECMDTVAPMTLIPKSGRAVAADGAMDVDSDSSDGSVAPPPPKRGRGRGRAVGRGGRQARGTGRGRAS